MTEPTHPIEPTEPTEPTDPDTDGAHPDQELPGGGRPSRPARPDIGLPGTPGDRPRPDQGLPGTAEPKR